MTLKFATPTWSQRPASRHASIAAYVSWIEMPRARCGGHRPVFAQCVSSQSLPVCFEHRSGS